MVSHDANRQSADRRPRCARRVAPTTRRGLLATGAVGLTLPIAGCLGGLGGASESKVIERPFVDPAKNLDKLHEDSDADRLAIDDSNEFLFARPEQPKQVVDRDVDQKQDENAKRKADPARIKRGEDNDQPTSLVYGPFENPQRLLVEAHFDGGNDFGTLTFERTNGEQWRTFEPEAHVYNDSAGGYSEAKETTGASWRNSQFVFDEFDGQYVYLRLTLSEGLVPWTPQVGHVRVE